MWTTLTQIISVLKRLKNAHYNLALWYSVVMIGLSIMLPSHHVVGSATSVALIGFFLERIAQCRL